MAAQANRRTAELNAESACEELRPEAQAIHTKNAPELPNQAEVAAHDAVYCPYRSCCEFYAAVSGK